MKHPLRRRRPMLTRPQVLVIGLLVTTGVMAVVSSGVGEDASAAYPPGLNGKIAFSRSGDGQTDVWVMDADGSDQTNLTLDQDDDAFAPRWSPDGAKIAYEVAVTNDDSDVWVMNADGSGKTAVA